MKLEYIKKKDEATVYIDYILGNITERQAMVKLAMSRVEFRNHLSSFVGVLLSNCPVPVDGWELVRKDGE